MVGYYDEARRIEDMGGVPPVNPEVYTLDTFIPLLQTLDYPVTKARVIHDLGKIMESVPF